MLLVNLSLAALVSILLVPQPVGRAEEDSVPLPRNVRAVWDLSKAERETTPTRERVCINGLWRWQPAEAAGRTGTHRQLGVLQGSRLLAGHHRLHAEGLPDRLRASTLEGRPAA